jgi:FkbM family methyltransferase
MEKLRQTIRKIVGPKSKIYKSGAELLNFMHVVKSEGFSKWLLFKKAGDPMFNSGAPFPIQLKKLRYPLFIRPGSRDGDHLINNVIREEYGKFRIIAEPEYIIDAGAYIGDTTTYFLTRFPNSKVFALEPNVECIEMLKTNLEAYGKRAILLKKGLFSKEGKQFFSGQSTGASISTFGGEIECATIKSIMKNFDLPKIDILKMDIEGAEEQIFLSTPEAWLNKVDLIIMEIHGPKIKSLISNILAKNNFTMKQYRSVWYCYNNSNKLTAT